MQIHINLILHYCLLVGTYTLTALASTGPDSLLQGGGQYVLSGKAQSYIANDEYEGSTHDQQWAMFDNGLTKAVQWSACSLARPHPRQLYTSLAHNVVT